MRQNSERSKMERWRNLIHNFGRIRFDKLITNSHVSVGEYNKLKSFFEHLYEHELRYDKQSKEWVSFASPETNAKAD
jgi:hypothetical protein